ncbi:hypothetical protein DFH07DRAFT_857591 [Mycena maculata]|uniref:DUF6534 domain-containing protein n=1 Tax=Mycena maculata TaxID=230809 RepID=A0AAD7HJL1_9AGAR|nr:hypothetical protein DFH07DRAFT_857591 [Mycena maculata]
MCGGDGYLTAMLRCRLHIALFLSGPLLVRPPLLPPRPSFAMNPNLIGSIEIGTLVAVILLGMVTVQIYVYYLNFPHDSRIIKSLIALVWVTEVAHVVGICYGLYRITVTRYGHLDLPIPLELCIAAILGNAIHPVVQAIFTTRIYQFGRNRANRILTAACWAISGFIFGATVLLSIKVFSAPDVNQFEEQWAWLIMGLFGATAAVDLVIAAAMCYYTLRNRASLRPEKPNTIDTFVSWTAQTGVFTSIAAITVVIFFALMKQNHIWLTLLILTTGLYSNSLLSLLNGRLQLGYQTEAPFSISLATFNRSHRTNRSQVQFSYPPTVHLKPPSVQMTNSKPPSNPSSPSTRSLAGSSRTASGMLTSPSLHHTLPREYSPRI